MSDLERVRTQMACDGCGKAMDVSKWTVGTYQGRIVRIQGRHRRVGIFCGESCLTDELSIRRASA